MKRSRLLAGGLGALMMLSGSSAVLGEETSQASEVEIVTESETVNGTENGLSEAAEDVAVSTGSDAAEERNDTADIASGDTAHSANDYESSLHYETYEVNKKTWMRAIVSIKNISEDKNLYVSGATFDLEDGDGHLIRCIDDIFALPDIIYPGNTGYLYCERIDLEGIDDVSAINVVPDFVVRSTTSVMHEYEDSDLSFRVGGERQIEANGRVKNTTDKDVDSMGVHIIYFDKDMNVLGIGSSHIDDIPAGATRSFGMQGLTYGNVDKIGDAVNYEFFVDD